MERLGFEPDADDVTTRYRRLVDAGVLTDDPAIGGALWDAMAAALNRAILFAAEGGCAPAALEAIDLELVRVVRAARDGYRRAFDAGLRAGAALGTLQAPSRT